MVTTCGECFFFNNGEPLSPGQHKAICPTIPKKAERIYRDQTEPACLYAKKSTLSPDQWELLRAPTINLPYCAICGKTYPLNQHHLVRKGDGNIYGFTGKPAKKPTITLCGSGNTSGCHGLAHSKKLHFRYSGALEYLITDEPTKRADALTMEGWRQV